MTAAMEVTATGAGQLHDLARRLRQAGRGDLRKELTRAIRVAAKPVAEGAKADVLALPAHGPKHTGLRKRVARSVKVRVRTSGRSVGVRIVAGPRGTTVGTLARYMDKGRWKHPVYGNRKVWVTQTVPPGWFTRPTHDAAPKARTEIGAAMARIRRQIEG